MTQLQDELMVACILGTSFLFFLFFFVFCRAWKVSISGIGEVARKEGENWIPGTGIQPYDRAVVWETMSYIMGFRAFT